MKKPIVYLSKFIPDFVMTGEFEGGRPIHLLQEDFEVRIDARLFCIPKGIKTDLGSIPRLLWSLYLPNNPDSVAGYLLHDVAYAAELWPRKYSDQLLLATMKFLEGKGKLLKYMAVRLFGWATYKNHSKSRIKKIRSLMGIDSMKCPLWEAGVFSMEKEEPKYTEVCKNFDCLDFRDDLQTKCGQCPTGDICCCECRNDETEEAKPNF